MGLVERDAIAESIAVVVFVAVEVLLLAGFNVPAVRHVGVLSGAADACVARLVGVLVVVVEVIGLEVVAPAFGGGVGVGAVAAGHF